jgi:hypothetical protein
MTVVIVAVVAVVTILVLLVGLLRARRATGVATRRTSAARAELSTVREELLAERERTEDLGHQLRDARQQAADAKETARLLAGHEPKQAGPFVAPASTVSAPPELESVTAAPQVATELVSGEPGPAPAPADRRGEALDALWSLTRIRQDWAGRQTATLGPTGDPGGGSWSSNTLGDVLAEEVARIREDTGTPGTLRLALEAEPRPADAVLLVLSIQTLLDTLSRHCQGYDLYVHEWQQRLTAIVVCEGFDGPDRVAIDASSVLGAISPAGGDVALDRDAQGRLRARLSLTVSPR